MWSKFTCLVMKYHCYCYTISMFGQKSFTKLRSIGWDRRSCNNPQFTQLLLGVANLIFERLREWFEARYFLWIFFIKTCTCMTFFSFPWKKSFFFRLTSVNFFRQWHGRVHIFPKSLTPPSKIKWSMSPETKISFVIPLKIHGICKQTVRSFTMENSKKFHFWIIFSWAAGLDFLKLYRRIKK